MTHFSITDEPDTIYRLLDAYRAPGSYIPYVTGITDGQARNAWVCIPREYVTDRSGLSLDALFQVFQ